jgi:hypothetical protein
MLEISENMCRQVQKIERMKDALVKKGWAHPRLTLLVCVGAVAYELMGLKPCAELTHLPELPQGS